MCLFLFSAFVGPRIAAAVWWLVLQPQRWQDAFHSDVWPALGVLFAPWTALMFVAVAPEGLVGRDWLLLTLAVLLDMLIFAGGIISPERPMSTSHPPEPEQAWGSGRQQDLEEAEPQC